MQKITAVIADIQRASVHDGPGIRTTVFFKGCPLHCSWCHNPECIDFAPQTLLYPDKCINCGHCAEGCYSGARILCGREMTVDEVTEQILLDKEYYGGGGGATLSGGEPMAQREFASLLTDTLRKNEIGVCIETSLSIFDAEILGKFDLVMCDFKIWNNEKHLLHVGISNDIIKENIKKLDALNVPFIVRTPIIPEVNDTADEIKSIAEFLSQFKNITGYELLPYHPLGVSKQKALGLPEKRFGIPSKEHMKELKKYADISR